MKNIIFIIIMNSLILEGSDKIITVNKDIHKSNSVLSTTEIKDAKMKENLKYRYIKYTYGHSLLAIDLNGKSEKFYGNTFDFSFNYSIRRTNNYIGPSVKSFYNENLNNLSYGVNYSYLFFFENKSFLSLNLFLGKGAFIHDNAIGKDYLSPNNFVLGKFVYDNDYERFDVLASAIVLHDKQYNFLEITPSVSFEIPIFDESGFNLAFEIFASRKKISNKYKNEFFDNIYLNSNEVGFRFGITHLK